MDFGITESLHETGGSLLVPRDISDDYGANAAAANSFEEVSDCDSVALLDCDSVPISAPKAPGNIEGNSERDAQFIQSNVLISLDQLVGAVHPQDTSEPMENPGDLMNFGMRMTENSADLFTDSAPSAMDPQIAAENQIGPSGLMENVAIETVVQCKSFEESFDGPVLPSSTMNGSARELEEDLVEQEGKITQHEQVDVSDKMSVDSNTFERNDDIRLESSSDNDVHLATLNEWDEADDHQNDSTSCKSSADDTTVVANNDVSGEISVDSRKSNVSDEETKQTSNGVDDESEKDLKTCKPAADEDLSQSSLSSKSVEGEKRDATKKTSCHSDGEVAAADATEDDAVMHTAMDGLWNRPGETQQLDESSMDLVETTSQNMSTASDDGMNSLMGLTIVSVRGEVDNEYAGMQRENEPRHLVYSKDDSQKLGPGPRSTGSAADVLTIAAEGSISQMSSEYISRKESFKRVKKQGPLSKRLKLNCEETLEKSKGIVEGILSDQNAEIDKVLIKQPKIYVEKLHISEVPSASEEGSESIQSDASTTIKILQRKDGIVQCPGCDKTPSNMSNLQVHIHRYHLEMPLPFQCKYCKLFFLKEVSIKNHLWMKHSVKYTDEEQKDSKTEYTLDVQLWACPLVPVVSPSKNLPESPSKIKQISEEVRQAKESLINAKATSSLKVVEKENGVLTCPGCDKTPSNMSNLQAHIQKYHPELVLPFVCNYCNMYFMREISIKNHLFLKHHIVYTEKEQRDSKTNVLLDLVVKDSPAESGSVNEDAFEGPELRISPSRDTYTPENSFEPDNSAHAVQSLEHLERPDGTFQCPCCPKVLSSWSNLQVHLHSYHADLPLPFHCRYCNLYFLKEVSIKNHLSLKHSVAFDEEEELCARTNFEDNSSTDALSKILGKVIKKEKDDDMDYLAASQQSYAPPEMATAVDSSVCSYDPEDLIHDNGSVTCPACQKVYSSLGNVHRHIHVAHPDAPMPFHCQKCNYGYLREETMKIHAQQCHKGQESFSQPLRNTSLIENESDFSPVSDAASDENMTVSDDRNKSCPVCDRSFLRMRSLHDHIHLKHPNFQTPYLCKICNKGFLKEESIKIHMIRKHKISYLDGEHREAFTETTPNVTKILNSSQDKADVARKSNKSVCGNVPKVCKDGRIKCAECSSIIQHWNNFRRHMTMKHPHIKAPFQCKSCSRGFFRKSSFSLHLQIKHGMDKTPEEDTAAETMTTTSHIKVKKEIGEILPVEGTEELSSKNFEMPAGSAYGVPYIKLKCPKCMAIKRSRREMDAHFRKQHGSELMPYQCPTCPGKGFFFRVSYLSHCKLFHHDYDMMNIKPVNKKGILHCIVIKDSSLEDEVNKEEQQPPAPPTPPQEDKSCPRCKREFSDVRSVEVHYREAHAEKDMPHSCPICKIKFLFKSRRTNHLMRTHEIPQEELEDYDDSDDEVQSGINSKLDVKEILLAVDDNICPRCNKEFTNLDTLQEHFCSMHDEPDLPFHCKICKKGFFKISQRKTHMVQSHRSPLAALSEDLSEEPPVISKKQKLDIHKLVQKKITPTTLSREQCLQALKTKACPSCAGKYSSVKFLMKHYRNMHNNKDLPYHCQVCDKGFFAQNSCKKHFVRLHSSFYSKMVKEQAPKCKAVPKDLPISPVVKREVEPKKQPVESTKFQAVLTKKEVANVLRTNACPRCPSRFSHIKSLEVHYRIVHDPAELPIHCEVCNKAFFTQARCDNHDVKAHRSKKHQPGGSPTKSHSFMPRIVLKSYDDSPRTPDGEDMDTPPVLTKSCGDITEDEARNAVENSVCPRCPVKFSDVKYMINHLRHMHPDVGLPYKCKICNKDFLRKVHRWRHEVLVHKSSMHADIEADFEEDIKNGKVILSNFHNKKELELARKQLICPVCKTGVKAVSTLDTHYTMYHDKTNMPYLCVPCDRGFFSIRTFWKHLSMHKSSHFSLPSSKPAVAAVATASRSKVAVQGLIRKYTKHNISKKRPQCTECGNFFITWHGMRKHFRKYHDSTKMPYRCGQCGQTFFKESEVHNHTKVVHRNAAVIERNDNLASTPVVPQITVEKKENGKFRNVNKTCPICHLRYANMKGVENHFRKNHDESQMTYICTICQRGFFKFNRLENHVRKMHKSLNYSPAHSKPTNSRLLVKDPTLDNTVEPAKNFGFVSNRKTRTANSSNVCPECSKIFDTPKGLDCHFRTYHPEVTMPYECRLCSVGYFLSSRLYSHFRNGHKMTLSMAAEEMSSIKTVGNNRFVKCPGCTSIFLNQNSRDNHYRSVHGEEVMPIHCHICQKGYFIRDMLVGHYKQFHGMDPSEIKEQSDVDPNFEETYVELEEKSTVAADIAKDDNGAELSVESGKVGTGTTFCSVCFEVFTSQELLDGHKEKNHGLKDVEPKQQELGLRTLRLAPIKTRDFTDRIKSKYGIKKHSCPKCGIGFSTETARLRHFRTIHGSDSVMPHKCTKCDRGYLEKSSLMLHMRRHHRPSITESDADINKDDVVISHSRSTPKVVRSRWAQLFSANTNSTSSPEATSESLVEDLTMENQSVASSQGSQETNLFCPHCSLEFSSRSSLWCHQQEKHKGMKETSTERVTGVVQPSVDEEECTVYVETSEQNTGSYSQESGLQLVQPILDKMQSQYLGPSYPNPDCGDEFSAEQDGSKHVRTAHLDDKPHRCPVCNRGYAQLPYLKKHMTQSGHNMAQFRTKKTTPEQSQQPESTSDKNRSINIEPSFKCLVENCLVQSFHELSEFTNHLASHRYHLLDFQTCIDGAEVVLEDGRRKSYRCPFCPSTFPCELEIEDHIHEAHGEVHHQFQCLDCPATFYLWGSALAHACIIHDRYLSEDFPSSLLDKSSSTHIELKELWHRMDSRAAEDEQRFLGSNSPVANQCMLCYKTCHRMYDAIWHQVMDHRTPADEIYKCVYVKYARKELSKQKPSISNGPEEDQIFGIEASDSTVVQHPSKGEMVSVSTSTSQSSVVTKPPSVMQPLKSQPDSKHSKVHTLSAVGLPKASATSVSFDLRGMAGMPANIEILTEKRQKTHKVQTLKQPIVIYPDEEEEKEWTQIPAEQSESTSTTSVGSRAIIQKPTQVLNALSMVVDAKNDDMDGDCIMVTNDDNVMFEPVTQSVSSTGNIDHVGDSADQGPGLCVVCGDEAPGMGNLTVCTSCAVPKSS